MTKEQQGGDLRLTSIHINLKDRSIVFETEERPVARLTLSSGQVLFEGVPEEEQGAPAQKEIAAGRESEPTVILTGKLKSKPREGRADRSGNPTAWARLAVHEEEREEAHMYIATFHRHTARIALALPKEAQITVEGYPHPAQSEKRLDSLSIVNVVNYSGKPKKERSSPSVSSS